MAIGRIIDVEIDKMLVSKKISLIKLIVGGAAIFAADIKNHQKVIAGKKVIIPLVRNNLRVCVVSYVIFAKANRAEEHKPWAILIDRAPSQPHVLEVIVAAVRSPMWPTDEYAIKDFRSGWRRQIILVRAAPHIAMLTIIGIKYRFINIKGVDIRRRP